MNGRVAPRCNTADGLLLVTLSRGHVTGSRFVPLEGPSWLDFLSLVGAQRIDTLVCGGISRDGKESLLARNIAVIEDVASPADEVVAALTAGRLHPGFGFEKGSAAGASGSAEAGRKTGAGPVDCLACRERLCLLGKKCPSQPGDAAGPASPAIGAMLESAQDITFEKERTLCRLSEVIYFGLEMKFRRIGVAYCIDLEEPARILVGVLRRFFETIPVCCKIGGLPVSEPELLATGSGGKMGAGPIACNPLGQAEMLNALNPDLNVVVGLCVGVDSVFAQASEAPVTTLFVKDKSLANNPIGALYSDYYLNEATTPPAVPS
jgi:uncharacterized metal-binding protein